MTPLCCVLVSIKCFATRLLASVITLELGQIAVVVALHFVIENFSLCRHRIRLQERCLRVIVNVLTCPKKIEGGRASMQSTYIYICVCVCV